MHILKKALSWLDDHLLTLITGFLVAFIPLFPKFPLFDALPGYIVRVRIEDFLVAGTFIIWLIQLWRHKISFGPNPLARPVLAYLTVGVLSMLSAMFITRTVPLEAIHVGKMVLHYLRRIEYFSLFFVFFSTVKSLKQIKGYLLTLLLTMIGITVYGYGQKYLYWNAYSTMNREFSKGWALVLTKGARVLSTFGGHYDLAAYTMGALILMWALFFTVKSKLWKAIIFLSLAAAFWLLILTASRTSFLAYLAGVTVLFFFFLFRYGIKWAVPRWVGVIILSIVVMLSFGDLSDRFLKLLKIDQRIGGIRSLLTRPLGEPPQNQNIAFLENNPDSLAAITSKSDFPPLPKQPPSDVVENLPEGVIASISASGAATRTEVARTYSKTAYLYDLSTSIRLDALWPRAIAGFMKNPLLGSGYSTLTKTQVAEFTEAESTDNDFLRALGETGLLGFLTFGWILGTIIVLAWKNFTRIKDPILFGFMMGAAAIVFGLLVNAVYIDIFESSKVAFSFWALIGIMLGAIKFLPKSETGSLALPSITDLGQTRKLVIGWLNKLIRSDKTYVLIILILAFVVRQYKIYGPLADWHSWRQADTSAVTRNFVRNGIDLLYPRYDDLSSVASGKPNPQGYRFVEFPLYNIASVITDKLFPGYSVEYSGRLTSIFASLGSLIFIYLLTKKYAGIKAALFSAFFFAILPYNIYWSRVILPEPTLVFLTSGLLYFFDKWIHSNRKRFWVLAVIFAALGLLVKFTACFFVIPMVYLAWRKWGTKLFINPWLIVFAILTIVPFGLWRWHISHYPEGIPAYLWLLNGNGIRFKGAWFWWLFGERIAKLILGGWGVGLLAFGLIKQRGNETKKENIWLFHWWLVALFVYLVVFATGNVQHDYYQIILVPILVIFMGLGADFLLTAKNINTWVGRGLLIISIGLMLSLGWYQARDLFNVNHPEIVEAGAQMQRILGDKKGNTIAPYGGDTAFLYQTGQRGWPLMEGTIDEMITKGADYYISVNKDDLTKQLTTIATEQKDPFHPFKLLKETDAFVIIQLVPDSRLPK